MTQILPFDFSQASASVHGRSTVWTSIVTIRHILLRLNKVTAGALKGDTVILFFRINHLRESKLLVSKRLSDSGHEFRILSHSRKSSFLTEIRFVRCSQHFSHAYHESCSPDSHNRKETRPMMPINMTPPSPSTTHITVMPVAHPTTPYLIQIISHSFCKGLSKHYSRLAILEERIV